MKEVTIERMVHHWGMLAMGVVLKEKEGSRRLLIYFDSEVGIAIVYGLASLPSPRPLPHDQFGKIIAALKGKVRHVVISEVKEKMFYAKIVLDYPGGSEELDARPSDVLAIAVRLKVPIFVVEPLLEMMAKNGPDLSKLTVVSTAWPFSPDVSVSPHDKSVAAG